MQKNEGYIEKKVVNIPCRIVQANATKHLLVNLIAIGAWKIYRGRLFQIFGDAFTNRLRVIALNANECGVDRIH